MPVPGLGINGRDDPVPGDPAGDPEHPVGALIQILAVVASGARRRFRARKFGGHAAIQRGGAAGAVPELEDVRSAWTLPPVPWSLSGGAAGWMILAGEVRARQGWQHGCAKDDNAGGSTGGREPGGGPRAALGGERRVARW